MISRKVLILFGVLHVLIASGMSLSSTLPLSQPKCKEKSVTCVCEIESESSRVNTTTDSCSSVVDVCGKLRGHGKCVPTKTTMPLLSGVPPRVSRKSAATLDEDVDANIDITCQVAPSNPPAHVYWLFKGKRITNVTNVRYDASQKSGTQYTLSIKRLSIDDSGIFNCVANNSHGSANQSFHLKISMPPGPSVKSIAIDGGLDVAYLGTRINLTCKVDLGSNDQLGGARFHRFHRQVDDGGRYNNLPFSDKSIFTRKLTISNVSLEDQGYWTCYGYRHGLNDSKVFLLKTVPCPAGYFCPWWSSKKIPCNYGSYSVGNMNATYNCKQCPGEVPPETALSRYDPPAQSPAECPRQDNKPLWTIAFPIIAFIIVVIFVYCKWRRRKLNLSGSSVLLNDNMETCDMDHVMVCPSNGFHGNLCNGVMQNQMLMQSEESPEFPTLYDVFICYSSKDIKFAKEIQVDLEKQGYKCCIDWRDFEIGEAIVINITNAIYHSRNTLAILSPDFIKSEYCKQELHQALNRSIRHHHVIPIIYRECDVPLELQHRTYLDYLNCYVKPYFWDQLKRRLGRGMQQSEQTSAT